jgi:hypothetical protein
VKKIKFLLILLIKSSMADNLLFEMTQESQQISEPFVSKQWVYCTDNNGGVYQNQILLDTASLSNSGKYCHFGESFFLLPLVLTLTSAGDAAGANAQDMTAISCAFSAGLKAGYWNILHNCSIEYNNVTVQNLTPFSNLYINWKMLTSLSQDDVYKNGPSMGFFPDTSSSFSSNFDGNGLWTINDDPAVDSAFTNGLGITNNRNCGVFSLGVRAVTGTIPAADARVVALQNDGADFALAGADDAARAASLVAVFRNEGAGANTQTIGNVAFRGIGRLVGAGANAANDADVPITINLTNQTLATGWVGDRSNLGFYRRQQNCSFDHAVEGYTRGILPRDAVESVLGKNTFRSGLQKSTPNDTVAWYILAKIRGKDISDFLDKLGLVKGAFLRFQMNLQTASHRIEYQRRAAGQLAVSSISNSVSNGCSPILYASSQTGQGSNAIRTAAGAAIGGAAGVRRFDLQLSLVRLNGTGITHPALTQVRLYVPIYQLSPPMEQQLLSLNRTKKIVYRDIMQYQVDVEGTMTFNTLLSNGVINPKTLIILPMIRAAASSLTATPSTGNISGYVHNAGNAPARVVPCPTWQSPFTTEPATSSPLTALTDLQILVSGQTIWSENQRYDFQQYVQELSSINSINGNLISGLTSGLISEDDWSYMYRAYVCDLSRRLESENEVPKSLQISGKNCSFQPITLFCFVEYEKNITIDVVSGSKISD